MKPLTIKNLNDNASFTFSFNTDYTHSKTIPFNKVKSLIQQKDETYLLEFYWGSVPFVDQSYIKAFKIEYQQP